MIYLILDCVMDGPAMILVIPAFLPVILSLDFGMSPGAAAVWFGILVLTVVEVGLITLPIGSTSTSSTRWPKACP